MPMGGNAWADWKWRRDSGRMQILICGAYGQGNAGDEAVLDALLQEIKRTGVPAEVTVLSKNCLETERRAAVTAVHPFFIPGVRKAIRKADVVLQGGGNLLQDQSSIRSLLYYLAFLEEARRQGKKVWLIGCGFGPFRTRMALQYTFRVLRRCTAGGAIREPESFDLALKNGLNPKTLHLSSDLTFALETPPIEKHGSILHGRTLGIVPRGGWTTPDWEKALADLARKRYAERKTIPVLLSLQKREDNEVVNRIEERIQDIPHIIMKIPPSGNFSIDIFSELTEVLSFRLHGLIFCIRGATPCAALGTDPKLAAFAADAGGAIPTVMEPSLEALEEALDFAEEKKNALAAVRQRLILRQKGNVDLLRTALQTEGSAGDVIATGKRERRKGFAG